MASRSPPLPPANLDRTDLPTVSVKPGELLRLFSLGRNPIYFRTPKRGQLAYRFDAPGGEYGLMYCAFSLDVCFAETLLRTRSHARPADQPTLIDESELRSKGIAQLGATGDRALILADMTGSGLVRMHCDGSISTTPRYAIPRQWALALWKHHKQVDGIRYVSRFMNSQYAAAVFDRVADRLSVAATLPLIEHPDLPRVLDQFNVGI